MESALNEGNSMSKVHLTAQLSEKILELVDSAEDMPRSDVQGCADAIAMNLVAEVEQSLEGDK